jgi:hypothetical protein
VKQEKKYLIIQLFESHVLIDSLKYENTMLLSTINELENKLEKFSSDNLKSMLCIHSNVSNKSGLTVDDLSTSTSHASDSKLDSRDDKESTSLLFCLGIVKPLSLKSGLLLPTCFV